MSQSQWILQKDHVSYWLRQIRKEMELVGPVRERQDIVYKSVDELHLIELDCPTLMPSMKEFLFPQMERMLKMTDAGMMDHFFSARRVVFGVRSCDISAIKLLDKFFLENYPDPYYRARRENTFFVSIACNKPESTCFCSGLGTGPFLRDGYDIQLFDLGDRYLVQCGSPEARRWVDDFSYIMSEPTETDLEDQYEVELSSQAMFQKRINLESAKQFINDGRFGLDFWQGVSERCFECGGCVYECPVCTCFSVMDRENDTATERLRLWDTCLFKGFTRMAGNVLPAQDRVLRTKRWFYHKLIYYTEQAGAFGCVGCGRCTITCPAKIDMATVVSRMNKYEK